MNGWMMLRSCLKLLSLIKIVCYKYCILYSINKLHVFNAPGWRESLCLQLLEIIESILHSSNKSGYFPQPHPIILLLIGFLVFYPLMVILGKKFTFLILIT